QDESRRQHQRQRLRPQPVRLALLQWHTVVGYLGAGIPPGKASDAGTPSPCAIDLHGGLLPGCAAPQPQDRREVRRMALALAAWLQSRVNVGIQRRRRVFRQNANDRVGLPLEQNRPPQRIRISAKSRAPQSVTQDGGPWPVGPIFVLQEV